MSRSAMTKTQLKGGATFGAPLRSTTGTSAAPKKLGNADMDEGTLRYKAMKYHYKIQSKLHEMQKQGRAIPNGYHTYLKPFQG